VRERFLEKEYIIKYVRIKDNLADLYTKILPLPTLRSLLDRVRSSLEWAGWKLDLFNHVTACMILQHMGGLLEIAFLGSGMWSSSVCALAPSI